jgi:hypothetical protein
VVNAKKDMIIKFKESESLLPSQRYSEGLNSFLLLRKMSWKYPCPQRNYSPTEKKDNKQIKI